MLHTRPAARGPALQRWASFCEGLRRVPRQRRRPRPAFARASALQPDPRQCCHQGEDSSQQASHIVTYTHPDAVRRRQEAELRKQLRAQDLQEMREAGPQWWAHQAPANMLVVSTRQEYDRALLQCKARHGLVVVDFFAPWCAGCRRLYPKMRQIAAANLDVAFIKVNTQPEDMMHLAQELGITGLPFFNLHAGHKVQAFAASLSKIGRVRTEIDTMKVWLAEQTGAVLQGIA